MPKIKFLLKRLALFALIFTMTFGMSVVSASADEWVYTPTATAVDFQQAVYKNVTIYYLDEAKKDQAVSILANIPQEHLAYFDKVVIYNGQVNKLKDMTTNAVSQNSWFDQTTANFTIYGEYWQHNNTIVLSSNLSKEYFQFTMLHEIGHALDASNGNAIAKSLTQEQIDKIASVAPMHNSKYIKASAYEAAAELYTWTFFGFSII